jgi:hypothetical protein
MISSLGTKGGKYINQVALPTCLNTQATIDVPSAVKDGLEHNFSGDACYNGNFTCAIITKNDSATFPFGRFRMPCLGYQ